MNSSMVKITLLTHFVLVYSCGKRTNETASSANNSSQILSNTNMRQSMGVNLTPTGTQPNEPKKDNAAAQKAQELPKSTPIKLKFEEALKKCLDVTSSMPYQNESDYKGGLNIIYPPTRSFPERILQLSVPTFKICQSSPKDQVFNCRDFSKSLMVCLDRLGFGDNVAPVVMGCFDENVGGDGLVGAHQINMVKNDKGEYCPMEPQSPMDSQPYGNCCSPNKGEAAMCANKKYCKARGELEPIRRGWPVFIPRDEALEEKCYLWNEKKNCYNVQVPIIGTDDGIPIDHLPRAITRDEIPNMPTIPVAPFPSTTPDCSNQNGTIMNYNPSSKKCENLKRP